MSQSTKTFYFTTKNHLLPSRRETVYKPGVTVDSTGTVLDNTQSGYNAEKKPVVVFIFLY